MPRTSSNLGRPGDAEMPSDADCWVFDVDGCLVDSLTGTSLRPGAKEILHSLAGRTRVLLWSAGGDDYAQARARQFQVDHLLSGFFSKEERDTRGHYVTAHLPIGPGSAVFVDDRPEDLAEDLEVVAVSPYLAGDAHDRGLEVVAQRAGLPPFPKR